MKTSAFHHFPFYNSFPSSMSHLKNFSFPTPPFASVLPSWANCCSLLLQFSRSHQKHSFSDPLFSPATKCSAPHSHLHAHYIYPFSIFIPEPPETRFLPLNTSFYLWLLLVLNWSWKIIIHHQNLVLLKFPWFVLFFCYFPSVHLSITTSCHLVFFQDPPPAFMTMWPYDDLVIILNIHLFTADLTVFIERKASENLAQICSPGTWPQKWCV